MTTSAISLPEITQTLGALQSPPTSPVNLSASTPSSQIFATALGQATSDLSSPPSTVTAGMNSTSWNPNAGADANSAGSLASVMAEVNLLTLLLSPPAGGATGSNSTAVASPLIAGAGVGPTNPAAASQVVSLATQLEGTPYVWGGTTTAGFDCSGLVQYVYHQAGVNLPRTSQEQATVGAPVASLAQAQPGDLLFFAGSDGTASSPGHVGIYVGNGQMIDAPYTGTVVQQQSLAQAGPIVAIRRVLPSAQQSSQVMGQVNVPGPYVAIIQSAAAANNIPASLLAAVIQQESGFNPNAVSSAGAQGIAQFMPTTASGMGVNPFDPTSAINGAASLLSAYSTRFGSYADALAAYNAGPSAVARYGGVPPYLETQAYVPAVLTLAGLENSAAARLP